MAISNLTPVEPWPSRKLPQDRFDASVKTAMDQMSVMVGELNSSFIPAANAAVDTVNTITPDIPAILDAPNQAASAAASAEAAANSADAAAESVTAAGQEVEKAKTEVERAKTEADRAKTEADRAEAIAGVGPATAEKLGLVKPQTGASDGFELGGDGTLRVRQATDTQRGSVLISVLAVAGTAPIAKEDGRLDKSWIPSALFNSRVVITESNAAWTPPVTGWARVTVIGGGGAGGGGSDYNYGGLGGKQGGTTSFGDIHAIGGSGGGGASYKCCGGGGGGAGSVVHGFVYLNTDSPVSVIIGAGGAAQKKYTTVSSGTDGVGPQKGLAGTPYSGGCGAAGASAGNPLHKDGSTVCGGVGGSGGLNGSGYGGGGGGGGAGAGYYDSVPGGAAGDGGAYGTEYGGAGGAGAIIVEYYDPEKETV